MYEIKKNVPMPECNRGRRKKNTKYPFKNMEPGDFFKIPFKPKKKRTKITTVRALAYQTSKEIEEETSIRPRFSIRSLPDGGIGVWRVD